MAEMGRKASRLHLRIAVTYSGTALADSEARGPIGVVAPFDLPTRPTLTSVFF